MGKVYKDKKSKGCALCKPHKHGWAPKKKAKVAALEKAMEKESEMLKDKQLREDLIDIAIAESRVKTKSKRFSSFLKEHEN